MYAWLARIFTGPLVDAIAGVVKSIESRKMTEAEVRAEIEKAVAATLRSTAATELEARRDVLIAELRGESWLQRNWRPMVAVAFAAVLLFYALILPIAVDWFGAPPVRVGDTLLGWIMRIVMVALGGYIGGRTVEKVAKTLRR